MTGITDQAEGARERGKEAVAAKGMRNPAAGPLSLTRSLAGRSIEFAVHAILPSPSSLFLPPPTRLLRTTGKENTSSLLALLTRRVGDWTDARSDRRSRLCCWRALGGSRSAQDSGTDDDEDDDENDTSLGLDLIFDLHFLAFGFFSLALYPLLSSLTATSMHLVPITAAATAAGFRHEASLDSIVCYLTMKAHERRQGRR